LGFKNELDKKNDAIQNLSHELDAIKQKEASTSKQINKLSTELEQIIVREGTSLTQWKQQISTAEARSENYRAQMDALTSQLAEATQEKRELRQQIETARRDQESRSNKNLDQFKQAAEEWKNKYNDLLSRQHKIEKKLSAAEKKLEDLKPDDIAKIRRRVKQYGKLYFIMRSKKEMAEERSQNWETALRQTATWILKDKLKLKDENIPTAIGPLVGATLELIQGSLVQDGDDDHQSHRRMSSSEDFDSKDFFAENGSPPISVESHETI
jgi:chromosome segregation ATPase